MNDLGEWHYDEEFIVEHSKFNDGGNVECGQFNVGVLGNTCCWFLPVYCLMDGFLGFFNRIMNVMMGVCKVYQRMSCYSNGS